MKKTHLKKIVVSTTMLSLLAIGGTTSQATSEQHLTPCQIVVSEVSGKTPKEVQTIQVTTGKSYRAIAKEANKLTEFQQKILNSKIFKFQELLLNKIVAKDSTPSSNKKDTLRISEDAIETDSNVLENVRWKQHTATQKPQIVADQQDEVIQVQQETEVQKTWQQQQAQRQQAIQQPQNQDSNGSRYNQNHPWCDGTGQGRHNQNHNGQGWHNGGHHGGRR